MDWEAKLKDLHDEQGKLWEKYKGAVDGELKTMKGEISKGKLSPETQETIDKMEKDFAGYETKIAEAVTHIEDQKKTEDAWEKKFKEMEAKLNRPRGGNDAGWQRKDFAYDYLYKEAIKDGNEEKSLATWEMLQFPESTTPEKKAMTFNDPETGGYLGPPEYVNEIIKELREITPVLTIAKVRTTSKNSMTFPKKTGTTTAKRRGESEPKVESDPVKYGAEQITLPEMYAYLDVSRMDLDDTAFNLEAEIREELVDAFAAKLGAEFINGSGPLQLEGLLTNPDIGETISGHASTLLTDSFIRWVEAGLKQQYKVSAKLMFNLNTLADIRLLEGGASEKMWVAGFGSVPNAVLGKQYIISEDMDDVGAGNYPILYGDFKKGYQIGMRLRLSIIRLIDTVMDALGQVRFSGSSRVGGKVTQAAAIKKMKISA